MSNLIKERLCRKRIRWLQQVEAYIHSELDHHRHLVISDISDEMNMSERQFFRKMHKLTGKTPNQFLQKVRMKRAKQILEKGEFKTIKDIVRATGFNDPDYFSKLYYSFYSRYPSSYFKKHKMAE